MTHDPDDIVPQDLTSCSESDLRALISEIRRLAISFPSGSPTFNRMVREWERVAAALQEWAVSPDTPPHTPRRAS